MNGMVLFHTLKNKSKKNEKNSNYENLKYVFLVGLRSGEQLNAVVQ